MRWLLWSDAPWDTTAYGRQVRDLVTALTADGHQVAVLAKHGLSGAAIRWHDIVVYPPHTNQLGVNAVGPSCRHWGADVVLSLYDVWAFPPDVANAIPVPWIAYFPLDNYPVPPRAIATLSRADYVTTYTQWASEALAEAGIANTYTPPGFNFELFKPVSAEEKLETRRMLRLPENGFIVTSVGANKGFPCRKAWGEIVQALAIFLHNHDDAYAYIHTMLAPIADGMNFIPHFQKLGIANDRVIYAPQPELYMGIEDAQMAQIYQASDALLSPSKAEGFGFPVLEAQACGIPVITQRTHAHGEINVNGITVPTSQRQWMPHLEYYWDAPSVTGTVEALETLYTDGVQNHMLTSARDVLRARYSHEVVWERHWKPFIAKVEAELW